MSSFLSVFEIKRKIGYYRLPTHIDAALIGNFVVHQFLF